MPKKTKVSSEVFQLAMEAAEKAKTSDASSERCNARPDPTLQIPLCTAYELLRDCRLSCVFIPSKRRFRAKVGPDFCSFCQLINKLAWPDPFATFAHSTQLLSREKGQVTNPHCPQLRLRRLSVCRGRQKNNTLSPKNCLDDGVHFRWRTPSSSS